MRKNRKHYVQSRVLPPPSVAGLIMLVVTLALVFWVMDSKCAQLGQEIRKCEKTFLERENERVREEVRWNEKNTPEKLEQALLQHGLAMDYPAAEQMVRMDAVGQPMEGQLSLRKFRAEWTGEAVLTPPPKPKAR